MWELAYWLKWVSYEEELVGSAFVTVSTPGSGLRPILPGGALLEVEPGFDEATLRRVLRAVSGC